MIILEKRQLGKSDVSISEIGLGCMSLPSNLEEAEKIIQTALEHGVTYYDTADLYDQGENEKMLGSLLKSHRQEVIIATKVGNRPNENGDGWHWDASKEWIQKAIHDSLKRLQTDYIDVYQLHGGTMEDNVDEVIDTMESLKKDGLIREYGISSIRPNVINRFLNKSSAVSVMMQYSLLDRRPEEWLSLLEQNDSTLLSRGSLAKGLLTEDEGLIRAKKTGDYLSYSNKELLDTLVKLKALDIPLNSIALHYVLQNGAAIVGASSKEQLMETIEAYKSKVSIEILEKAAEITKKDKYTEHRI
ncbi:aldo/keto reductase [Psychrobacillus sp. FSL K6-2684]|uniref:aldo/keto reductase n=1 Tax=Psychrobacillus sp. FSL K6-2684 TaxID=2921547 RepID=UPI0030F9DEE1